MMPQLVGGAKIIAPIRPQYQGIITPEAMQFVAHLARFAGGPRWHWSQGLIVPQGLLAGVGIGPSLQNKGGGNPPARRDGGRGSRVSMALQLTSFRPAARRRFTPRVKELLQRRVEVQARFDAGEKPKFLEATRHVRGMGGCQGGVRGGLRDCSPEAQARPRSAAHPPSVHARLPRHGHARECAPPAEPSHSLARRSRSGRARGRWRRCRRTCRTGAWRSRVPPTARW